MSAFLVPYKPEWKLAYEEEAKAIEDALGNVIVRLHHIGSTAIPGILAKPIIDLLGTVSVLADIDENARDLEASGYEVMGAYGIEGRRYFRKADRNGIRTHHLHVYEEGSPHVERHLAFRDYLLAHPTLATEYSALKERLARGDDPARDAYQSGKGPFISRIEPQAVDWYRKNK